MWSQTRGHRATLAVALVVGLAGAGAGLLVPLAIGYLVDTIARGTADTRTWAGVAVVLLLSAVAAAAGAALSIRLATRTYYTLLADLREQLIERALRLPHHVVERAGTGDLVSRSSDDVAQIGDAAPQLVPALTAAAFAAVVGLAGIATLDPWYALAVAAMLPVYAFALRWYLATAPTLYRTERAAMTTRAQQIVESARGAATIAGLGIADSGHRRVLTASWTVVGPSLRARTAQNMFLGRLLAAQYLGLVVVLVVGYVLVGDGTSSVGGVTAAALVLIRAFGPITQLLLVFDTVQSVLASLGRIVGVIAIPSHDGCAGLWAGGDVRLERVRFGYGGGPPVVDRLDLAIPAGQHLGVVGASGAGKSTLAGLVAGVHRPEAGTIRRPRSAMLITQETHVFAGTVRDNLTLVAPDASTEQLLDALDAVDADLLDGLDDGLDTVVGAAGHTLTPVQVQQIALARVVLADPVTVVLDEATADAGSTHAEALDRSARAALRGRTGLVIAHRLSQAAACHRVVVVDDGRIVEDGTHHDLVAARARYAELWNAWGQVRGVGPTLEP